MIIKFYCKNHCADFDKDSIELEYQNQSFRKCAFCGEKLQIENLKDIVLLDIKIKVKNNITKWANEIGMDNVIDLLKRNSNQACFKFYKEELESRGIKLNV